MIFGIGMTIMLAMQYGFDRAQTGGTAGKFITVRILSFKAYKIGVLIVKVKPLRRIVAKNKKKPLTQLEIYGSR
jgi:hypothetical protein